MYRPISGWRSRPASQAWWWRGKVDVADQAQQLRDYMRQTRQRARVLAVTSGKGGVGKTSVSVNLAIALAAQGQRVVVLDADLGLANVEVLLGLNSMYNLQQVVQGEKRLEDVVVQGPGGIHIIPGCSGIARVADLTPDARDRILRGIDGLQQRMDVIIIDTMAGIGQNAMAFAAAADEVLVVTTPEPSAIVDAYAAFKTVFQLRDDAVVRLIVNQALNEAQARAVGQKLHHVAQQYLGHRLEYFGFVPRDPHVSQAVMQSVPFTLRYPAAAASRGIETIALRLLNQRDAQRGRVSEFFNRFARTVGMAGTG
jgi:flagellar biosynthesis protein FlhG